MTSTRSTAYRHLLQKLRAARRQAGLSQAEVARAIRRPQSYVSKCETGERRLDVFELAELARLYRKPLADFVADIEVRSGLPAVAERGTTYGGPRRPAARPRPRKRR